MEKGKAVKVYWLTEKGKFAFEEAKRFLKRLEKRLQNGPHT